MSQATVNRKRRRPAAIAPPIDPRCADRGTLSHSSGRPQPPAPPSEFRLSDLRPQHAPDPAAANDDPRPTADAVLGDLIAGSVNAGARQRDEQGMPLSRSLMVEAIARVRRGGLIGPERLDPVVWGAALEEIGYRCEDASFPLLLDYRLAVIDLIERHHTTVASPIIAGVRSGQALVSFAYSEGHDPFSFETRAEPVGSGYRIRGRKVPVAGALTSDFFLTFAARPDNDLLAVLVHRDDPGVTIRPFACSGFRSLGLAELVFEDVHLGPDRLLAEVDGLGVAQEFLEARRLTMPCWVTGQMQAVVEATVAEVTGRERYGLPLSEMQTVQATIGRMHAATEIARAMAHHALRWADPSDRSVWSSPTTTTKYVVIEQAQLVTRLAQSVVGGVGVFAGSPFERTMRDFACLGVTAGTQQTLEVDLGIDTIETISRQVRARARASETATELPTSPEQGADP